MNIYLVTFGCVLALAVGQILFKACANAAGTRGITDPTTLLTFAMAIAIYAAATLCWIWVLQKIELGKIYPMMALAFIIVPLGSAIFFGERFGNQYYLGILLISAGIVLIGRSQ